MVQKSDQDAERSIVASRRRPVPTSISKWIGLKSRTSEKIEEEGEPKPKKACLEAYHVCFATETIVPTEGSVPSTRGNKRGVVLRSTFGAAPFVRGQEGTLLDDDVDGRSMTALEDRAIAARSNTDLIWLSGAVNTIVKIASKNTSSHQYKPGCR
ncbi:hypothetical protein FA15DRAFT_660313 [Coprinopsis marcescibilis]|uniref:Uncharacterized protein n=1 Tax=Coprinopsis marcescibilis TaxID=230819 RepID=A0A5C3KG94_COPMA|nr:hypothetical protein FA15DRAFT_660313 [Coprinopsis marcescibilis]